MCKLKKERNKRMAELYEEGKTQKEIGEMFGISKARSSEIINLVLGKERMKELKREKIMRTAKKSNERYLNSRKTLK